MDDNNDHSFLIFKGCEVEPAQSYESDDIAASTPSCSTGNVVKEGLNDTSSSQPDRRALAMLKQYFGHRKFKPLQWRIIDSVVNERRDQCVVMGTGYGKSLCFQFPAVYMNKLSVVISPLISLMEEQVRKMNLLGVASCLLGSVETDTASTMDKILRQYRLVYMTPEYLIADSGSILKHLDDTIGLAVVAIDEAQCVSQWSNDFKSSYMQLKCVKDSVCSIPIIALTTTTTPAVRNDIMISLGLTKPCVTITSVDRPNLFVEVLNKTSSILQDLRKVLPSDGRTITVTEPTIIYCPTHKASETVQSYLQCAGCACDVYHDGLTPGRRKETLERFATDKIKLIVTTVASVLSVHRPDIRRVIHYGAPQDIESYYQEIGRAGRDGFPATCTAFYAGKDFVSYKDKSDKWWKAFGRMMLTANYITEKPCGRTTFGVMSVPTTLGDQWLASVNRPDGTRTLMLTPSKPLLDVDATAPGSVLSVASEPSSSLATSPDVIILPKVKVRNYEFTRTGVAFTLKSKKEPILDLMSASVLEDPQTSLYNSLIELRKKLAADIQVPAYMIASDRALLDIAAKRPHNLVDLHLMEDLSAAQINNFATHCLSVVKQFIEEHQKLQNLESPGQNPTMEPATLPRQFESTLATLRPTEQASYMQFNCEKLSLNEIAWLRGLREVTIAGHLGAAIRAGLPLDVIRLGLTKQQYEVIVKSIRMPPLNSDITRMSLINEHLSDEFTFSIIKTALAVMEFEYGLCAPRLFAAAPAKIQYFPPVVSSPVDIVISSSESTSFTSRALAPVKVNTGEFFPPMPGYGAGSSSPVPCPLRKAVSIPTSEPGVLRVVAAASSPTCHPIQSPANWTAPTITAATTIGNNEFINPVVCQTRGTSTSSLVVGSQPQTNRRKLPKKYITITNEPQFCTVSDNPVTRPKRKRNFL